MITVPLFNHYVTPSAELRAAADQSRAAATEFATLVGDLATRANTVSGVLEGPLLGEVNDLIDVNRGSATQLGRAALLSAGVFELFAGSIDTYNSGVDALNNRWDQAVATGFGVPGPVCTADQTTKQAEQVHAAAVASARSELRRELVRQEALLEQTLDDDANAAAAMLDKGPDDADTTTKLMGLGLIPTNGVDLVYPKELVKQGLALEKVVAATYKGIKVPFEVVAIRRFVLAATNANELASALQTTQGTWSAVLDAMETSKLIDTTTLASLNTYLQSEQEISAAQAASAAATEAAGASYGTVLEKIGLASKFGKGLAFVSLASTAYGIYDDATHWDDYDTTHKVTHVAEDTAGLASSVAAIAIVAGASGPAAPVVLVGAGLVAAGLAVYDNWDEICAGADTAKDWVGDRVSDIGDGLKSAADEAGKLLDDITPW